jgi:predicted TIM-barrel fold metal-dependent hydrolase
MGLAKGIFMVDTHTHAQRFAFKFKEKGLKPDYATLSDGMPESVCYDNSDRMLYFMDRYNVDVCVIQPAFGMSNEINAEIVKKHPDRFVAFCSDIKTQERHRKGIKEWNLKDSLQEIDELLSTGMFVGIGECMPGFAGKKSWEQRFEEICQYMELCRKYKVPAQYHTGFPSGYAGGSGLSKVQGHFEIDHANPLLCHEVASAYPDVPIVMAHAGIEGSGYFTMYYEMCLNVAASHDNVYLECGQWWAELYEKPLKDPNIGCEKLVWGTDWGASCTAQSWMPGCVPETYVNQDINLGPPSHQIDIWGWSLRELGRLNIPQDDLNLILGGNAVRLYGIKTPFTRLFKEYLNRPPKKWFQDNAKKDAAKK